MSFNIGDQLRRNPGSSQFGIGGTHMAGSGEQAMTQHLGRANQNPGMMGSRPYSGNGQNINYMSVPASTDSWGGSRKRISGQIGDDGTFSSYVVLSKIFEGEGVEDSVIGANGLAPLITTKYRTIAVRSGRFNVALPVRWAPRGQTHGTSYNVESRAFTLTDYASGFEFPLELLEDPEGPEILRMSLEALNEGIRGHLMLEAYNRILNMDDQWSKDWIIEAKRQNQAGMMSAEQWIERDMRALGFLQRSSMPMEDLDLYMDDITRPFANSTGVLPDTIIVGPEIGRYLLKVPAYTSFYRAGAGAEAFARGGPANALQSRTRFKVHMVKPTLVNGVDPFDILNGMYKIGFFAEMSYSETSAQACGSNKYTTASRDIEIFDSDRDDYSRIALENAFTDSGRWDTATPQKYLRPIDATETGKTDFRDSFYTDKNNSAGIAVLHHFLGQQKPAHVKTRDLEDIASSAFESMTALKAMETSSAAVTNAFDTLIAAKKIMESVRVDDNAFNWVSALVYTNQSKGSTPSPIAGFENTRIMSSSLDAPVIGSALAKGADWTAGGWLLPPFSATGPGFRMIAQSTTAPLPNGKSFVQAYGYSEAEARKVAEAYRIIEQFAHYAQGAMPTSAALNSAYGSPSMELSSVDTFIDQALGNYRAPLYGYFGAATGTTDPTPVSASAADAQTMVGGRTGPYLLQNLGISAPRLQLLESSFIGYSFDDPNAAAGAAAAATFTAQRINADLSSFGQAANTFRLAVRPGQEEPKFVSSDSTKLRPIMIDNAGVVQANTTPEGLAVLRIASNFFYAAAPGTQVIDVPGLIATERARAFLLFLLSQVDTSDESKINANIAKLLTVIRAVDNGSLGSLMDTADAIRLQTPVTNAQLADLFSREFAAAVTADPRPLTSAITTRAVLSEGRAITAAAEALAKLTPAQITALFPANLAIDTPAAAAQIASLADYVLMPLTYSPTQLLQYAKYRDANRTELLSFIPADPADFRLLLSNTRRLELMAVLTGPVATRPAVLANLDKSIASDYAKLPSYIIGQQISNSANYQLLDLQDWLGPVNQNTRDEHLPLLLEQDPSFQAQIGAVNSINNSVQRVLAMAWALTPPSLTALSTMMDKNVRVPFSVLVMRPWVILTTTGLTACLAGGQNTVFAHPIGTYGANATQQLMAGVLSFSSMCVVTANQSIIHLKDLLITGVHSGLGVRTATGGNSGSVAKYLGVHDGDESTPESGRGDVYYLVEPAYYNKSSYADVISGLGDWTMLEQTHGVQFSGLKESHFYNTAWFKYWFKTDDVNANSNTPESLARNGGSTPIETMVMFRDTYKRFNASSCAFELRKGAARGPINPDDVRPGLIQSWNSMMPLSALRVTLV